MKTATARAQINKIASALSELQKIKNPTDRDWSLLTEQYQQFVDRMDERETNPPEIVPIGLTDEELDRLADNLVERMHT
jgi:hypothetical protein